MAIARKFVDRFPEIGTAGKPSPSQGDSVADCMTFPLNLADVAEIVVKHLAPRSSTDVKSDTPTLPSPYSHYRNYNTQVKDIFEADIKKGFEAIRAELRETAYKSYWRDEVGQIPDQIPNLPLGMDPENTIFGHLPLAKSSAAELLNPRKCKALIDYEDQIGHHLYRISHNQSYPGEQKKWSPPVLQAVPKSGVPKRRPLTDDSGRGAHKLFRWFDQSTLSTTSKPLADYKNLHYYSLGKNRVLSGVPDSINENTIFGVTVHHNETPVLKEPKKLIPLLVAFVSNLRFAAKKIGLDFRMVKTHFNSLDSEKSGKLPAETVYSTMRKFGMNIDVEMMQHALTFLNYFDPKEDRIIYASFLDLLNIKKDVPSFGKVLSEDQEKMQNTTIYREFCDDLSKKSQMGQLRIDFCDTRAPNQLPPGPGWCLAHLNDLPNQTTVDDVLRPNVFTHHGLTPYDCFKPRSAEFIRDLFINKVGLSITDEMFRIMWEEGVRRDGVVSVETFKNILNEISTGKLEQMADTAIEAKTVDGSKKCK